MRGGSASGERACTCVWQRNLAASMQMHSGVLHVYSGERACARQPCGPHPYPACRPPEGVRYGRAPRTSVAFPVQARLVFGGTAGAPHVHLQLTPLAYCLCTCSACVYYMYTACAVRVHTTKYSLGRCARMPRSRYAGCAPVACPSDGWVGGSEIWLARGVSGDRRRHVHELWSESQSDDLVPCVLRERALCERRERGRGYRLQQGV